MEKSFRPPSPKDFSKATEARAALAARGYRGKPLHLPCLERKRLSALSSWLCPFLLGGNLIHSNKHSAVSIQPSEAGLLADFNQTR